MAARRLQLLSALSVEAASTPGYMHDGGGLYLQVGSGGGKSWIFRYTAAGKRREMGLGTYKRKANDKAAVGLANARTLAADARALVEAGKDPIDERDAERRRQRLERGRGITFDQAVERFLDAHEDSWRNQKHREQWRTTLRTYASPTMGNLSVAAVGTPEVTKVLSAIWKKKPETASRLRGRIERILDWAKTQELRPPGENPARWRGHLENLFARRSKLQPQKHHAATPIDELPEVYRRLGESSTMAALALRFLILTAARAGECVGASWSEIDLDAAIWALPGSRMKAGADHRVPLSVEAIVLLRELEKARTGIHVFPGRKHGRPISIPALSLALTAAGGGEATVHGMRSTFKDWASERTSFAREVSEMALAHTIGTKVEAAYRRGDLLEKRRAMMEQWATFITTPADSKVVPIGQRRA